MSLWYLTNLRRLEQERADIADLEARASWLRGIVWSIDGERRLCVDADIEVGALVRPVQLRYPAYFPATPPAVTPREATERWSSHQWGPQGELCLEWGPDNWRPDVTGAHMLESAHRLLEGEQPAEAEDEARPPVPSRHETTLGQDLRLAGYRLVVGPETNAQLASIPRDGNASVCVTMMSSRRDLVGFVASVELGGNEAWRDREHPRTLARDGWQWRPRVVRTTTWPHDPGFDTVAAVRAAVDAHGGDSRVLDQHLAEHSSVGCSVLVVPTANPPVLYWVFDRVNGRLQEFKSLVLQSQDRSLRVGILDETLASKKVGIVGLGSVGSKMAVSLARTGIRRFLLIDDDVLLPENLCRHELDWRSVGAHKVDAVAGAIEALVPNAEIGVHRIRVTGQESTTHVADVIARLSRCDLVIDASADPRAFCMLAEVCRQAKVPMLWMEVLAGGIGGLIARYRPGKESEPLTMRARILAWDAHHPDETVQSAGNYSVRDDSGDVHVATDSDVSVIAAYSAGMALDTLLAREPSNYPHSAYHVGLSRGWIFKEPFEVTPLDLFAADEEGTEASTNPTSRETVEFLTDLVSKGVGGDHSSE